MNDREFEDRLEHWAASRKERPFSTDLRVSLKEGGGSASSWQGMALRHPALAASLLLALTMMKLGLFLGLFLRSL